VIVLSAPPGTPKPSALALALVSRIEEPSGRPVGRSAENCAAEGRLATIASSASPAASLTIWLRMTLKLPLTSGLAA